MKSMHTLTAFLFYILIMIMIMIFLSSSSMHTISVSYTGGNETDHQALLNIKSMISHDPYGVLSSWNTCFHHCDWSGVICGKRHRRVTIVRLISKGLVGTLSPHVGNLSFLIGFSLRNNSFRGSIPHELGRLFRLRVIVLEHNNFTGVIPSNVSGCYNLEELWFGDNKLVGNIPKEISFLSRLKYVSLFYNQLTGGIPSFLGNITSIKGFSIPGNPLGGSIPDSLGHLKSLKVFYVGECNLTGTIPNSFYNLSFLTTLSFGVNQLTGSLATAIGEMLPHLEALQLRNNQLTGVLPPSLSNSSKLRVLDISDNKFTGKLSIDFAKLTDIYEISLGVNLYEHGETNEMKFIDSLKNCSRLGILELDNCKFKGVLPRSIGNLSDQLYFLTLEGNQLHGSLPSSIGNLVGLTTLSIGTNRFTGKIPSTIGKLQKLQYAGLYENQYSGSIPDTIGNLSMLITLDLDSNRLEGHIPSSLGRCHNLLKLYLDGNKLIGNIPKQLLQLSTLSIILNLSHNSLSGSLPTEVEDLKMLSSMDLSYNNLSGNIPINLGGCTSLALLSLRANLFQGLIPPALSSLRGLAVLDLSQNNLSGQIPGFLERFSFEYLNLSFNNFEGEVPIKGVFANASAFSVLGNSRLCGGLVEVGLPRCNKTKKHKKKFPLFVIVLSIILFTLFSIICLAYVLCKKKSKRQPSQSSRNEQFLQVSYGQLLKATDGFSEANLIGQGAFSSVYRGILDNDDIFVAIKVLHLQNQGAQKSFMRECETWRNIRHRNLLKIITSCSSVDYQGNDFKALVYEFMPNGSLHDWLHSSERTSRLNLLQRINIIIDVATAIDYLHNHCLTTIVHGDLKPSNILLDDDMVAHVGDFGLSRFLTTDAQQTTSNGVKGTVGYVPPEYGLGSNMTRSGDIYSFGILLLEVITGKQPTNEIFIEGLSLHKFASMALPNHVTDIIDGDLLNYHQYDAFAVKSKSLNAKQIEECVASTVKIGVSCSVESPSQRMNIVNVVHELQHILDTLQNA